VDHEAEIAAGAKLHTDILRAVLARDPDAAEAASHALNDYLVDFTYAALGGQHTPD
jgi:DNA-binding FadR family transcriptional regulator